jgi:NAD(P)-dependent dehydrogenase (short-subunit alcohol dehydrogenase family)
MTVTVIAGGSAGIGQSAAVRIAEGGSGVILTYKSHPEGAQETVEEIERRGGTAVALPLDLGVVDSFPAFRESVVEALAQTWSTDRIAGLVNNAGVGQMAMLGDLTDDVYETLHRVNFKGPLFLTQALVPLMQDGGAILNTTSSSTQPLGIEVGYSVYAAMKGGLVVLTRYLAKELSPRGIRVNSVSPGTTRTRLGGDAFAKYPELIPPIAARTALGRIGESDDIGAVIAFLMSDAAAWITAQDIEVSGGYNL